MVRHNKIHIQTDNPQIVAKLIENSTDLDFGFSHSLPNEGKRILGHVGDDHKPTIFEITKKD